MMVGKQIVAEQIDDAHLGVSKKVPNKTQKSIDIGEEVGDSPSEENTESENKDCQQSDQTALSWNIGWYECMLAFEDKKRSKAALFQRKDSVELNHSNEDKLDTEEIEQAGVNIAFHHFQQQMTETQQQVIEHQNIIHSLKACLKRNISLENEVADLRSKNGKLRQDISKKVSQQKKQMERISQTYTNLVHELMSLKLNIAQIRTDEDIAQWALAKMTQELKMLKNDYASRQNEMMDVQGRTKQVFDHLKLADCSLMKTRKINFIDKTRVDKRSPVASSA